MTLTARIGIAWPALKVDVDLELTAGRTLAIMGPNGAGKSSILRALAGLLPLHTGFIRCSEIVWDDPTTKTFLSPGRRNVGLVFQDHVLFRHLTALDNVAFGPRARGLSKSESRNLATTCLEQLGLGEFADLRPSQLSGGQSQRVALSRALVNKPDLLLLDEPLASLDVVTRRHMRSEIVRGLASHRPMTILVTHDPDDARHLADEVMVIENGSVVQFGTLAEVSEEPASPYIAQLFGSS